MPLPLLHHFVLELGGEFARGHIEQALVHDGQQGDVRLFLLGGMEGERVNFV